MTENEQIEDRNELVDLLEDIGHDWDSYLDRCIEEEEQPELSYEDFHADSILAAGYRKASEVAREIFEELLKMVSQKMPTKLLFVIHQKGYDDGVVQGKREAFFDIIEVVSELKKKYGGKNNDGERADTGDGEGY